MKLEKQTEIFYILNYLLELIIKNWQSGDFFFEFWRIWAIFFRGKSLYRSKSYFSAGRSLVKFRQEKKTRVQHLQSSHTAFPLIGIVPQQEEKSFAIWVGSGLCWKTTSL